VSKSDTGKWKESTQRRRGRSGETVPALSLFSSQYQSQWDAGVNRIGHVQLSSAHRDAAFIQPRRQAMGLPLVAEWVKPLAAVHAGQGSLPVRVEA